MSEIVSPLVYQLGLGGIGGFIVGFTIKKISKLIVILIGLFIIALLYMGASGIISVNYEKLRDSLAGLLNLAGEAAGWLIGLISLIPFFGSFFAGFLLGFKIG
ncbi:MAG: FUN14 domain-containing protein [Candidatus Bathycorpusculaceae bacterium]